MKTLGPWTALILGLILQAVFLGVVDLSLCAITSLIRRLFPTLLSPNRSIGSEASRSILVWFVLFLGITSIGRYLEPKPPRRNRPVASRSLIDVAVPGAILVAVVGGLVAFRYSLLYDFRLHHAVRRFNGGDIDGAINDVREQIEDKGPTLQRVEMLGLMMLRSQRPDEAADLFRKAEMLGGITWNSRLSLAQSLLDSGRLEEAIPLLLDAARAVPKNAKVSCPIYLQVSQALASAGRWQEAREHYSRAVVAATVLSNSDRTAMSESFELCRLKLEEASQAGTKPGASVAL
jgi:tetratricopeptide (TPR) repeat protein